MPTAQLANNGLNFREFGHGNPSRVHVSRASHNDHQPFCHRILDHESYPEDNFHSTGTAAFHIAHPASVIAPPLSAPGFHDPASRDARHIP
jgi:hypothetical protein